ncbi:MAG TPA: hypothetical protein VGR71_12180, partial [Nitrospira sp.]|nr:hypothetical protein [Nitrospira sp.]
RTAIANQPTAVRQPIIEPDQPGRLVIHDGKYYYDVSDYKTGPDAFKRTRLREITPSGDKVFEKSPPLIHPDLAEKINSAYEDNSWFRKNPLLSTILGGSTQAKRALLSWSPFHWTTEYWRGIQMGLTPWEALMPEKLTENSLAVKSKFPPTLSTARERSLAQEGLASGAPLVEKIPILGTAQKALDEGLFGPNGYIDRLKGSTFGKVVNQLSKRHPNWTQDQIHYSASRTVDAAFGGLDWKMLGASANTRDFLRLIMLAPDFTGSQVMFGGLGFQAGGSAVTHSLARIAAVNFGIAQTLNMLFSGKVRLDHPFSVVSPDGKKVYGIRTMTGDLAHMLTDPRQFAYNRMSPALRIGSELLTGRDEQGKRITAERQLHEMLRNVLPIPSQSALPGFRRDDEKWYESGLRGVGFSVQPEVSYALGKARQLASDHSPSGPVDEDRLHQHRIVLSLESRLRGGEIDTAAVNQMVTDGRISQEDRKNIMKNYRDTQHMSDQLADLYAKASHLPMNEFLDVYEVATPEEKASMHRLLLDKEQKFL